jgi:hypothetical protein
MNRISAYSESGTLLFEAPRTLDIPSDVFGLLFVVVVGVGLHASAGHHIIVQAWGVGIIALVIFNWLWDFAGIEQLTVTPSVLIRCRMLLGVSKTTIYEMEKIRGPHFLPSRIPTKTKRVATQSALGFFVGGKRIAVCGRITEPQARQFISSIIRQYPELASVWGRYDEGEPMPEPGPSPHIFPE